MKPPTFFITGHGRSGTHYMASLFQSFGYDVGAQKNGENGQSHNFPPIWPFTKIKESHDYLIQVVRNPWKVVESTCLAYYSIPEVYKRRIPDIIKGCDSKLDESARTVVVWNQEIKMAGPDLTVKVEDAPEVCRQWLLSIGLEPISERPNPPATINARNAGGWAMNGVVPWDDLGKENLNALKQHCREYGYSDERIIE